MRYPPKNEYIEIKINGEEFTIFTSEEMGTEAFYKNIHRCFDMYMDNREYLDKKNNRT